MLIDIDPKDGRPAYLQIVAQVKYAAASGRLRAGEALPSIRQLAMRLRVNRNTVDKAYRELDRQGVIDTIRGKGAFISHRESPCDENLEQTVLSEAVDRLIVQAHHFHMTDERLLDLLSRRLEAFAEKRRKARETPFKEVGHGRS